MTAPIGLPPQPSQTLFSGKKKKQKKQAQEQQAITQAKNVITFSKEAPAPEASSKNTLNTSNLFISYPLNEAKLRKNIHSYDELSLNKKTTLPVQGIQAHLIDSDDLNKRISSRLEDSQKDTFTLVVNKAGQQRLTAQELQQLGLPKEKTALMAKALTELLANEPDQKRGDLLTGSLFSIAQKAKATGKLDTTNSQTGVNTPATAKPATETTKADAPKTETKDNEKKENEGGGILQGWKKTKMGLGAALLAGGIALKMTLIGIVPGLIMAGAGAALMGWATINWAMGGNKDGDKTDENKDKKADAPATENK